MTFDQLCNKLNHVDGIYRCDIAPDNRSVNIKYDCSSDVPPWIVTLYDNGSVKWCEANKASFPTKAYDLIDKYRTQVRYGNACDDNQSKKADEKMTFYELANQLDDLGLTAFTHQDGMGNKYLEIPNFADSVHIYANHTIKYMGSKHKFWATITNSRKVHKIVNEFVKGDNHMTKKGINEQISEDIQQLAKDLTKKKEIEHSTKMSKKIADDLGVKLPKRTLSDK